MPLLDLPGIALLHTLLTTNSLSRLSTLSASLNLSVDQILSIVGTYPFVFVRLRATDDPGDDRIAVVLDLTNCTFYARPPSGCSKDHLCPYLHLCPSVVLPNRRCQRPEDCSLSHSLDTEHNRQVILQRGLENLPLRTLIMLVLASADPTQTFSVCHQKPKPCRETNCDDLHLCYFYLCSPQLCKYGDCKAGHSLLTERNLGYLQRRDLAQVESNDVLALFRIVDENKKHCHLYRYQFEAVQPQPMMLMTVICLPCNLQVIRRTQQRDRMMNMSFFLAHFSRTSRCSVVSPMDEVITLIEHLLKTKHSIDRLESICKQLNIDNDRVFKLIRAERYEDYFQFLRPDTHRKHQGGKLALTLDLFCCTHYAQQCKNQACPFLHLCPYNIRPMHGKCTNKNCPYDHEVLTSAHNKKIINTRGLSFISDAVLLEIARASADPTRSFWVCTDHGKKGGCSKKSLCDKFHYCYYSLTDACTKPYCPHVINEACAAYFRQKEIIDQEHDDILDAFHKVLRQRKTDFLKTVRVSAHPTSTPNASTVVTVAQQNPVSFDQDFPSLHSPIRSSLSATAPAYNGTVVSRSFVLPEQETDLILCDSLEQDDTNAIERYLTEEIGYPMKLLSSKAISSSRKALSSLAQRGQATHYFCPIEKSMDLFRLLRWQNAEKAAVEPLVVYASVRDAHEATELNIEHKHFCLLRLHLLHGNLFYEHSLRLDDPSPVYFDRMWIYMYDG